MYIRDNTTGVVREYGSDKHDSLVISEDGKTLYYYNLQCGEGSKYGAYSIVTDERGLIPLHDEKIGLDTAYANIGGFHSKKQKRPKMQPCDACKWSDPEHAQCFDGHIQREGIKHCEGFQADCKEPSEV